MTRRCQLRYASIAPRAVYDVCMKNEFEASVQRALVEIRIWVVEREDIIEARTASNFVDSRDCDE
jgi:hypothetical protein